MRSAAPHRLTLVGLSLGLAACAVIPEPPPRVPIDVAATPAALVEPFLKDACKRYEAGHRDRATTLSCGKWMFFYETYGTAGLPASIVDFLLKHFSDILGPAFSELGMIPDPRSKDGLPFGLARGAPVGLAPAYAFTCAACHISRLPDGRVAVGMPNHAYDYGKLILAMVALPMTSVGKPIDHDSEAVAFLEPMLARLKQQPALFARFGGALLQAAAAFHYPKLTRELEHAYATWPAGTMDFIVVPNRIDDGVDVVTKIPALYDIPREGNVLLGWAGSGRSLSHFTYGFVMLGGGNKARWTVERLTPLTEYIYSLKAPSNPRAADAATVATGKAVFESAKCPDCHSGPAHGGTRLYRLDEIGTDDRIASWLDPKQTGRACCDAKLIDPITGATKSPRLTALWAQRRFLHNGSLTSLEQLLCLEPRPKAQPPLGSDGHHDGCALPVPARQALIAYLKTL